VARDEQRLLRLQRQLAGYKLLIVDELGHVPLSPTGAKVRKWRAERNRRTTPNDVPGPLDCQSLLWTLSSFI
jgi:hypothetical protein